MMSKNVAIYCRVSTVEQADEGYSIDEQRRRGEEYCNSNGYNVYNIYEDRGISGKNISGRPGVKRLIEDAKDKKFDLLIVWKLNRLSRDLSDILTIEKLLTKYKIAFRSLTEGFETETNSGKLQLSIMGAIAEFERGTISENVKMGMIARAKEGRWNGGSVLGYDVKELPNEGNKRKNTALFINEEEANTVRRIFELYSKGNGYKAIVNSINKDGYITKRGNHFAVSTVRDILNNPVYIGKIRFNLYRDYNKYKRQNKNPNPIIVDGLHAPIIDLRLWEKVQVMLKERSKVYERNHENKYLLTGILKCPVCGSSMTLGRSTYKRKDGTKGVNEYYVCSKWKNKGGVACKSNSVKVNEANEHVMARVMELVNKESVLKNVIENINQNKSSRAKPVKESIQKIEKEIETFKDKKEKALELYEDGILNKSDLSERLGAINDKISNMEHRIIGLKQEESFADGEEIDLKMVKLIMDKFKEVFLSASTIEQRKKLIHLLVSKITISEDRVIDSIELQINSDVVKYLMMEDRLPKQKGSLSFLPFKQLNCGSLKFVI
ncbi:recombinase family protein [Metaclostridioides mangenotii]|uniref:recombinase family protein n=1 Tax=Metaclostridioides mangenotii TaxID=1540 RepID=UPI0026EDDEB3|nr:recombinase family protein [Clostridioides mangenotii]